MLSNSRRRAVALWLMLALPACAQYPGHVQTAKKPSAILRSIAVLEWTGDPGKPKASRIIPIAVFDGETYQPGGLYLARPAPLAVEPGTEYVLQEAGVSRGLFDIGNAQDVNGYWFGYGAWKPVLAPVKHTKAKQGTRMPQVVDGGEDGKPHMKIRHPEDSSSSGSASGTSSGGTSSTTADKSSSGQESSRDPDRPTLRKRSDAASSPSAETDEVKTPETATKGADPDRPHMAHGQQTPTDSEIKAAQLTGVPSELQQMIAVSDVNDRETHPFIYLWNDPADAGNMQKLMEAAASKAIAAYQTPATKAVKSHPAVSTAQRRRAPLKPAEPALLTFANEHFKAYELTYSGGATLVYSAETTSKAGKTQYVTLIAQPDFNGVPRVLFTSVTDQDHLDQKPRMRLIDAVDAKASNRGDLIFELRSQHEREFAIYRISGGLAEQVFTTGPLNSSEIAADTAGN